MNDTDLEKNINRIISQLSDEKGYICSIDVLLGLNYFNIEKAYSTHFVNKYQIRKLKEIKNTLADTNDLHLTRPDN